MRISFDLDDTLICYQSSVPKEKNRIPWLLRRWLTEPFAAGQCGVDSGAAGTRMGCVGVHHVRAVSVVGQLLALVLWNSGGRSD